MSDEARLEWRCRRGTLELDLLMSRYLKERYPTVEDKQQHAFQRLLEYSDDVLQDLLTGQVVAQDREVADVIKQIRSADFSST
ncbi:MAG: succinate dehydrogenase assembly factor 2 [Pseudomonadota bacterium]